eukprot:SAG25_NODE_235_length_11344_cov_3.848911_17_plen_60_part_00
MGCGNPRPESMSTATALKQGRHKYDSSASHVRKRPPLKSSAAVHGPQRASDVQAECHPL